MRLLIFAILYSTGALLAGVLLGILRVLLLEPAWGGLVAVALELPVILLWCLLLCRRLCRRLPLPGRIGAGLAGAFALLLLLLAEAGLATTLGGLDVAEHFARYGCLEVQLGLAGQLLFAAFPAFLCRPPVTVRRW